MPTALLGALTIEHAVHDRRLEPQESASLVACIEAFCALPASDLTAVSEQIYDYYLHIAAEVGSGEWVVRSSCRQCQMAPGTWPVSAQQ